MDQINYSKNKNAILLSIFVISISLFLYQVVLTRLYSVVFWYHYVFLITSFAIFGLGIGSIFAYKYKFKMTKGTNNCIDVIKQLSNGAMILGMAYVAVLTLIYWLPYVNNLIIYIFLGTIPFIIGGYIFSIVFMEYSEISGKLYFADLVGSGIASAAVIILLNQAGLYRTMVLICVISLIPVLILPAASRKIKISRVLLPIILIAGLMLPQKYVYSIEQNFNGILNNAQKTYGSLEKSETYPEIVFSEWNAFSRTDVIKIPQRPDEMTVTIDGAANAPMYEFDGNIESLEKFKNDIGYLPFSMEDSNKTLVIGPGGGRDILYALAGGSKDITAVEINTSSIDAVKAFGAYNGNIYNRPEVEVYGEDGRSFVRRSKDKYDIIFLSLVMTNASQGMGYALSENYIYTVEAINDYLDHLSDNGEIAFLVHDENDLNKIVATAIEALTSRGTPEEEAPNHIAVFATFMSHESGVMMHNPLVMIKNKPFSQSESMALLNAAENGGSTPLYMPGILEEGPLHHIREAHVSLADYLNEFDSNVTPATDDSPYFYDFVKGVPTTLLIILFLVITSSIVLFQSFALKDRNLKPMLYFGLLGIGFMMIEIPLIQKFILYLGHPVLAFTYVLASLLIGSGIGGFLSSKKWFDRKIKAFYLPAVLAAVINILLLLSLDFIFQNTSYLDLVGRIIISCVLVMIQGFFMGMPFPRGLKLIGDKGRNSIIPVLWGVNGAMSVVGSVLSIIISMTMGFTGALIVGSIIYLIVSLYKI